MMYLELFFRYLHFISIFAIVGTLTAEHLLLQPTMSRKAINRLAVIDGIYGVSSIVLLIAGFSLWFWVGKPVTFYSHNPIFITKIVLVGLMGILSIYPTVFFLRHRKGNDEMVAIPKMVITIVRIELLLLIIIPIFATLMARGIGLIN